ncbi:MAG: proline dehydrogenase [Sphingobacteriaceae bacterium]|nr:MAG: proline dehydrogenase [Sphingobacteriaceae bacterium]
MNNLLTIGAEALRKAALNQEAKDFLLNNQVLYKTLRKAADRYIGGETLGETVTKAIIENNRGFKCSIEFMGENVKTSAEAEEATAEFVRICQSITNKQLHSTVSLDLSHIGLNISRDLCLENLDKICKAAGNIEVIISAEGTEQTDNVLNAYKETSIRHNSLAITLQTYLYRTADDFADLIKLPGRIRVVKGAFATPEGLSMPRGQQLNDAYLGYVDRLLSHGHKCAIATHEHSPQWENYEFESLYGIQTQHLVTLKNEGYHTKIYFVYGREWYLYLCNRIAEHPMNLFQALADVVG